MLEIILPKRLLTVSLTDLGRVLLLFSLFIYLFIFFLSVKNCIVRGRSFSCVIKKYFSRFIPYGRPHFKKNDSV